MKSFKKNNYFFDKLKKDITFAIPLQKETYRGVAQLASAPALGAGGPPFESEYPDKKGAIFAPFFVFLLNENNNPYR